jgi:16S rRNA (guanine527-N7)-methyltransferase
MVTEVTAPAGAAGLLGAALPLAGHYAELLIGPGVERGLIGPAEATRIWDRHILNCAVLADLVPAHCSLVDLGSGAGLPGIVLAMLRPEAKITLVDPMARRVIFLAECLAELGLANVDVVRGRAEDLAGEIAADIVTARAVAPLSRLAGWAVGLCRPGGTVLAMKGAGALDEVNKSRLVLRRLGVTDLEVLQVGSEKVDPPATVVKFLTPARRGNAGSQTGRRAADRRSGRQPGGPRPAAGRRGGRGMREPGGRRGDG